MHISQKSKQQGRGFSRASPATRINDLNSGPPISYSIATITVCNTTHRPKYIPMQLPLKLFHNCRLRPSIGQSASKKAHLHCLMPCHVALARGEEGKHVQKEGGKSKKKESTTIPGGGWVDWVVSKEPGPPLGDEFPFLSRTRSPSDAT